MPPRYPWCAGLSLLLFLVLPGAGVRAQAPERLEEVAAEVGRLRAQVIAVEGQSRRRDAVLEELVREVKLMNEQSGAAPRTPPVFPIAGAFLAGPSLASDSVGVAKVAVFAPRVEIDSARRHDILFLKLRRIEADEARPVGEAELSQDQDGVDLPIDRSGALYVVDWSTSEGHSYSLLLKDGASGQTAASVQVKPLQSKGRFLLVGYRLE